MQVAKLHRYVSRLGPVAVGLLTAKALETAENEGWPILPPVVARSDIQGFRCYGRLARSPTTARLNRGAAPDDALTVFRER